MNKLKTNGHQGDLNFRKIDKIPDGFKKIDKNKEFDKSRGGITLALGEHSNHAHTVIERKDNSYEIYKDSQSRHCLVIYEDVELLHGTFIAPSKINELETDKHNVITFAPGIYLQDFEEMYDPFLKVARRVVD